LAWEDKDKVTTGVLF